MSLTIENPWTKETRVLEPMNGRYHMPSLPWKVKGAVTTHERTVALATLASEVGIPMSRMLTGLRWLMNIECSYCQVGGRFLALLERGKISREQAKVLIGQVVVAKENNDTAKLEELKGWLKS